MVVWYSHTLIVVTDDKVAQLRSGNRNGLILPQPPNRVIHAVHKYFLLSSLLFIYFLSQKIADTIHKDVHTYWTHQTTKHHLCVKLFDMDSIKSTVSVGVTLAGMISAFSTAVVMGVRILSPLTNLLQDRLPNRGLALFFTTWIPMILATVTIVIETVEFEKSGLDVTLALADTLVAKACAEAVVALLLLRLVLEILCRI